MEYDTLRVSWTMEAGLDGIDDDGLNPFNRSVQRLVRNGQPIDKTGLVLINCGTESCPDIRWFGVFSCTAGGHLSFFPGYASLPDECASYRGKSAMFQIGRPIDHVTLEPNRRKWHATTQGSARHFGGPTTLPLGDDRVLWFGASIAAPGALRKLMKLTTMTARVPSTDAERRRAIFCKAVQHVDTQLLNPTSPVGVEGASEIYHWSIIVGPVGFPDYAGGEHALPIGSPWLDGEISPSAADLLASRYRMGLGEHCEVQINVMKLSCRLRDVSIAFTSPALQMTSNAETSK